MSEKHRWNILSDHFKKKGFVHHQVDSFNHYIDVGVPKIITQEPPIVIAPKTEKERKEKKFDKYTVSFSDVYIPSPTITEEDRTLRGFYPSEGRQRDLTYSSPIYTTVTEKLEVEGQEDEINIHRRVVLGRVPIMLRSSRCYLTDMTPQERVKAGECKKDNGGYFLVKGKERVLVAQLRGVYNVPMVLKQKPDEKFKYISEIRSMSEETGHSVLLQALIGSDDRTLVFSLPYIKDQIPIGIVFKALGYKTEQFGDLIGLSCDKVSKYIRLIMHDSFQVEQGSGFALFAEEYLDEVKEGNPKLKTAELNMLLEEMWEELKEEEQTEWKDLTTRNNALLYIGQRSMNVQKETERRVYAQQVVENELFPHMGVTSTITEKAYLLGHIVHKLLATSIGMRKPDSRDNYCNKRVESAGVLCYDLTRQLFKKYTSSIVTAIEKKKQLPDAMAIIPRLTDITKGLMHCFVAGTLITQSNGLSIPIEKLSEKGGEYVLGWNGSGLVPSSQTGLIKQGIKNTVVLTFESGKTLTCTPDHKILIMDNEVPKWVEASKIPINSRMVAGVEYPEDDMELNPEWKLEVSYETRKGVKNQVFDLTTLENRNKTLALSRMIGYILSDGHIHKDRRNGGSIYIGTIVDLNNFIKDYELITGNTPVFHDRTSEKWGSIFSINLRTELTHLLREIKGMCIGKKTTQPICFPQFITESNCPVSVVREFLGGLFGGDGHCPKLDRRKGQRTCITGVAFSWTTDIKYIDNLKNTFTELQKLLEKVGVPNCYLNGPYKPSSGQEDRMFYRLHTPANTNFSKNVGFRYCAHKACKSTIAALYWEMEENIKRQHKFVSGKVNKLKEEKGRKISIKSALELAQTELKENEYVLNNYYSMSSVRDIRKRREKGRSPELKYLQKKYGVPDAEEYINGMGVLEWFDGCYVNDRDSCEIPYFTTKLVNIRDGQPQEVYDIGVNETHSFLACGQVVHNCFSTGNWGVPKNSYIRAGVAQILSRLSYGATLSNLRRVTIPVGKESKNTAIRQIDSSQIMYICPAECFDPETQILMWQGEAKRAGDIVVGDMLVDDLGNPTRVKSTCSGQKNMYDVIPDKKNFTQHRVTDNHILTLRIRQHKQVAQTQRKDRKYTHVVGFFDRTDQKYKQKYFNTFETADQFVASFSDDDTLDITINDYLNLNKTTRDKLVLYKIDGVNWGKKDVEMDPYILGMWLGDGLSTGKGFALNYKTDHETLEYWEKWAKENGAIVTKGVRYDYSICSKKNKEAGDTPGMCNRVEEAPLKKYLRKYDLIGNKHIPMDYITNDRKTRLSVLAGLVDTDGSVRAKGREIRICQGPANYRVIEDAHKLAMSLGFSCGVKEGKSQWTDEKSGEKKFSTYKELTITGAGIYEIPTLLPRKKLVRIEDKTQLARSRSFMGSKFKLIKTGVGPYVGWQLEDKRGRFSLNCGLSLHNTPEGQPVGIVLNLSLLTRISERFPTVLVKEVVEMCENMTLINDFDGPNEESKVFLNGIFLGMTDDPYELLDEVKQLRKVKMLPYDVSVNYDDIDEEVRIYSDEGRLLRPVFVVEGGKILAEEKDGTDWDTLVEKGFIQYVDNSEIDNAVVAFHPNELERYHNDYCEIAAAMMLGVMASIIPFPDHSQSPRNCYQSAMGKQAMSMFALSHLIRADTVVHVLNNPQKPLVGTRAGAIKGFNEMPSGINCIVGIACYTGYNQEDSVILNYSAVQRGLFWATTYRTHSQEEKRQGYNAEKVGVPPLDKRRQDVNYGLLDENGVVRLRHPVWTDSKGKKQGGGAVYVGKGDVIIGKMAIQSNKSGKEELTDCSVVIKKGEEGYVDRIFSTITPNGFRLTKVVIRTIRIPEVGDKFASRAAQKGTCGAVYRQEDMPWTMEGIVPDIIINPHCIPPRMTINQLLECVLGKSCCIDGTFGDSTPFTESSVNIAETLCDRLHMNGYERTGKEVLYNGMTGEPMGQFFIGPVYYQRLKHLVSDKMHARATGPVTTLTRQPLEGRSRDGGLRFGEMERDCMIAHGTSEFLLERLFKQSDPYSAPVCGKCGNFATSKTECKSCKTDDVAQVKLPYVSKLLLQELNAMMLKTKITAKA